jgi:hypothetical protein
MMKMLIPQYPCRRGAVMRYAGAGLDGECLTPKTPSAGGTSNPRCATGNFFAQASHR